MDRVIATLATQQHGVVALRQLRALDLLPGAIRHRLRTGRLHPIHRGVYAVGHTCLSVRGRWLAAVLACGDHAVLSHRCAARMWGLGRAAGQAAEVTAPGEGRRGSRGLTIHRTQLHPEDRGVRDRIPVTSVARTLFDLGEALHPSRLQRAFEEADRLGLLNLRALERICVRSHGRHALEPVRRVMGEFVVPPDTRSELENRFAKLCREAGLPAPSTNVLVADYQVDALWAAQGLVVELDGYAFHGHRAAFERDRVRDAALAVAGYRVLRLTHRRLTTEPDSVAGEIRRLLASERP